MDRLSLVGVAVDEEGCFVCLLPPCKHNPSGLLIRALSYYCWRRATETIPLKKKRSKTQNRNMAEKKHGSATQSSRTVGVSLNSLTRTLDILRQSFKYPPFFIVRAKEMRLARLVCTRGSDTPGHTSVCRMYGACYYRTELNVCGLNVRRYRRQGGKIVLLTPPHSTRKGFQQ